MPVITAQILKGRSTDTKRRLAAALTSATSEILDLEPQSIHVLIEEYDRENWAIAGELFSDRQTAPAAGDIDLDSLFKTPQPEKTKPEAKAAAKAPPRKEPAKSRPRR